MTLYRSLLGITALTTLACSRQPTQYVIGAVGQQQLQPGIQNQHGISLAVEEINRAGGINGVPLRVVVRDDHGSGVDAARVAADFVASPEIIAVVGHVNSAAMVSAARIYDNGKLVAVGTTPSSPDLTGISPWVFRMITSDSMNGVILARFASSLGAKLDHPIRAAILYENDAYGRGLAYAFERNFHGKIISINPVGAGNDIEPYVAYYKLQKPDLVFVSGTDKTGIPLLNEAAKERLTTTFLGGDGWQTVARDSAAEAVYVGTPFTAQSLDTAAQRFITAFRNKFGNLPDAHAALAYDATKLLAQAITVVGPDRAKVRSYLSNLTDVQPFHGVEGPVRFTPENDPVGDNFRVTRVHAGLLMPVEGR